ncbi:MAG: MG2 domain-containing protein [Gemmataceae bacterium]
MTLPADFAARADAYHYGLLSPDEAVAFERELPDNAELRAALDLARRRAALLEAALPPAEASEQLVRVTLQRLERVDRFRHRQRRLFWTAFLSPVAAAAIMIGLFQMHYQNLAASPANLEIYGQSKLIPGSEAALRVRLTDAHSQAPMPGVPVEVRLGDASGAKSVTLASFTTDRQGNGQPSFRLPDWADGQYVLSVTASSPKQPEVLSRTVTFRRSSKVMLTTDKPEYQPGQTIHVRSLTMRKPDLQPAAGVEALFTITDPKGNMIFRKTMRTSAYGIAAVDCELADELIEGAYTVTCRVGDSDSSATVQVHHYVLPRIKLTVTTERPWYVAGEEVRGTVQASYIHGEPVAGADWTMDLSAADAQNLLKQKIGGRTDFDGKGTFSFIMALNFPTWRETGRVSMFIKLRDTAGQEQTKTGVVYAAMQPLKFEFIPESGELVAGVPNRLFVFVSRPDGTPAKARFRATVRTFIRENPSSGTWTTPRPPPFEMGPPINYELASNDLGIGVIEFTPTDSPYVVQVEAFDGDNRIAMDWARLFPSQVAPDYVLRTDKAVYSAGDTVTVNVLGGGGARPVFFDILKDGQTVRNGLIEMADGRGEAQFDLPPELFGTVQLVAYRFNAQGQPVRKQRTLYIRPARELSISARPDKPQYRPGEKAKIDFTLTDAMGQPAAGALSLAVVDEAVFELAHQMPGMERTFYLLEQELLKPVYRIYNWVPDVVPGQDSPARNQFEQALFAKTVQTSEGDGIARKGVSVDPSPFSLTGSTFGPKVQETQRLRGERLELIQIAWYCLFALMVLTVYVVLWRVIRWYYMVALHGLALVVGVAALIVFVYGTQSSAKFAGASRQTEMPTGAAPGTKMAPANLDPRAAPPDAKTLVAPVHVRERFPETLLWQPQLITDDAGHASLEVEMADSITTWRLTASAVSADGQLGALQTGLRVFQPFFVDLNLPVALTLNDEIELPAVVSNYLPNAQAVTLTLAGGDWFDLAGESAKTIDLKPREVRSVAFRINAKKVGRHELRLDAKAGDVADAVVRKIEVVPDGRRVEQITNGSLSGPTTVELTLPPDAVEGSGRALVRIYPTAFSQLVDGLDGIFRLPTGCFEQTSSSLYPNVMALGYLCKHGQSVPEVEAKARQYIHVGYQRLLTFEVPGGGFDWYGHAPANITLTAYGLMEFRDMQAVHDVDPKLIERTQRWLLSQRQADGSWPVADTVHRDDAAQNRLRTTAYVAWAMFSGSPENAGPTREFLLKHARDSINDPYIVALVANALLAIDPKDEAARPYLERLETLKRTSEDGKLAWWDLGANRQTAFYGTGPCGSVETTALAALAYVKAGVQAATVRAALAWLVERRGDGNWGSTQATILALKALLEGTGKAADGRRVIEIALDGKPVQKLDIPADEAEVMKQVDLSPLLKPGTQRLTLREAGNAGTGFQVALRYHVRGEAPPADEPLTIALKYDRDKLAVGQHLGVTATVNNRLKETAPMVMIDLPVPAGFAVESSDFDRLEQEDKIGRYQVTPRQVIVYLRSLAPAATLDLHYRLKATTAAILTAPPGRVYEYYDPTKQGRGGAARLAVSPQ